MALVTRCLIVLQNERCKEFSNPLKCNINKIDSCDDVTYVIKGLEIKAR